MTFKDVIDEAFSPDIEKWIATKLQTATIEKNQADLQQLKNLQTEIANQKKLDQQKQQQAQQAQQPKPAQIQSTPAMQTATTAQLSAN
jgi:hypothetical protein